MDSMRAELSAYKLARANEFLQVSKLNLDNGFYNDCISRAYYAVFTAILALTALDGFDSSKHQGIISHFNKEYVKTGIFDKTHSRIVSIAFDLRSKSDYGDFFSASMEQAEEQYHAACSFVKDIETYLSGRSAEGY